MYNSHNELAKALSAHAPATKIPPSATTTRGPKRSTNQPSTGTSHVSVAMKTLNASWMAAAPQWYFWSIGLTKSVQPYCRLAIITMQSTPTTSCPQRPAGCATAASGAMAGDSALIVSVPVDTRPVRGVLQDVALRAIRSWKALG